MTRQDNNHNRNIFDDEHNNIRFWIDVWFTPKLILFASGCSTFVRLLFWFVKVWYIHIFYLWVSSWFLLFRYHAVGRRTLARGWPHASAKQCHCASSLLSETPLLLVLGDHVVKSYNLKFRLIALYQLNFYVAGKSHIRFQNLLSCNHYHNILQTINFHIFHKNTFLYDEFLL